jgi:hypothetical protein
MRKLQLITSAGDLILPLLLYFWWKWDLHFILLFVYIDVLAAIAIAYVKERKILRTLKSKRETPIILRKVFIYCCFVFMGILLFEWAIARLYPDMNLWNSFIEFLWFIELGIPQIIWLAPLVFLFNFQQYRGFFLRMNMHHVTPLVYQQKTHLITFYLFLGNAILFFGLTWLFTAPKTVFLLVLIFNKLTSDLLILPKLQQRALDKLLISQND